MRVSSCVAVLSLLLLPAFAFADPATVPANEARLHVGQEVTVCGTVASTAYLAHVRGEPTFLNLERPHPNQAFTAVIWGRHRDTFTRPPEVLYRDRKICVTGRVTLYKGTPQIEVRDPAQIRVTAAGLDANRFDDEERLVLKALLAFLGHDVDYATVEWGADADTALRTFRRERGLAEDEGWPVTLRSLAESADGLTGEQTLRIVRLLLLNLAQSQSSAG